MKEDEVQVVRNDCRSCSKNTRHEVITSVEDKNRHDWLNEVETWRVVRCLGCHTYSFQHRLDDYDEIEEDSDGNLIHSVTVVVYPSVIKNHHGLTQTYHLPQLISTIYQQTLKALSQNANVLASIGLRACIEAVCNHLEISGTNLQKRIDQLFKAGHVSNGDKKRLHAIRFLGNDAAHEIKQPQFMEIRIALEIVEHLLNTLFILEHKASTLETVAENYQDFVKLLESCAARHKSGNSINLLGLLGKQRRLISVSIEPFETQLISEIDAGTLIFLTKATAVAENEKDIQLYDVNIQYFNDRFDDEIPF